MNYSIHTLKTKEESENALAVLRKKFNEDTYKRQKAQRHLNANLVNGDKLFADIDKNLSEQNELRQLMDKATAHMQAPLQKHLEATKDLQKKLEARRKAIGPVSLVMKQLQLWQIEMSLPNLQSLIDHVEIKHQELLKAIPPESTAEKLARLHQSKEQKIPAIQMTFAEYKAKHSIADKVAIDATMDAGLQALLQRIKGDEDRAALFQKIKKKKLDLHYFRLRSIRRASRYLETIAKHRNAMHSLKIFLDIEKSNLPTHLTTDATNDAHNKINKLKNEIIDLEIAANRYNPTTLLLTECEVEMMEVMQGLVRVLEGKLGEGFSEFWQR